MTFDADLMFRTTGDLTQSESKGPVTVYGTPVRGMAVRVTVPEANGANDTILPRLHASEDGTNYYLISLLEGGAVKPYGGKDLILPFSLPKGQKTYLKLELLVTALSTTTNFGAVTAGIVLGRGAEVDRSVSWAL